MLKFAEHRKFIENEFQEAKWDTKSGVSVDELLSMTQKYMEENKDLSMPIMRANIFKMILENAQIEINPHTIFADKINTGVIYVNTASKDMYEGDVFIPVRDKVLSEHLGEEYNHMKLGRKICVGQSWNDFWHTVPDWNNVLKLGFSGILKKAKYERDSMQKKGELTQKKSDFYDSVIICFEAIIAYLHRLHKASLAYDIPEYSNALLHLTENAPEDLYQVMLMTVLYVYMEEIGVERARSLGPIDVMYYPYFKKELENGKSLEEIGDMFKFFYIHYTAAKRFAQQPFVIGGCDAEGNDRTNELSLLILQWYDELNILNPKIHIRYHENINEKLMIKALDMIRRGNSSICILNDEFVFKGYEKLGIPKKDAAEYVPLGCYEPIIMGMEEAEIGAAWLNMVKAVEFTLSGGKDIKTGIQYNKETPLDFSDFDEFYDAFISHMDEIVNFSMNHILKQGNLSSKINPSPIYSASFTDCLEKGIDVHEWPLKYNNVSVKCFGLATVVDSLMMVKKYVFDLKEISYSELRTAILNDWAGYEDLQIRIKNDTEKYGNNKENPDKILKDITEHLWTLIENKETGRNGVFRLGTDSIFFNWKMSDGVWATPDGRNAGDVVSKNLCASPGQDRKGITGLMNSLTKIDQAKLIDSAVLDFMVHPSAVSGEKGLHAFYDLMKTYFKKGGMALQGNIVDVETLKKARENPDEYKTLQIRVCGWNEYFVRVNPKMQETFIKATM